MTATEAIALIKPGINAATPQSWADLGCGSGTFTIALNSILPAGSYLAAVDKQQQTLPVDFIRANFETDDLPLKDLDGIVMANSLHYIRDKQELIKKLETYFSGSPTFLIVEYDTSRSNTWVPYPIPFNNLKTMFNDLGYHNINKLAEHRSIYNSAKIYAALIEKK